MVWKEGDIFTSGDRVYEVVGCGDGRLMYKVFDDKTTLKRSVSVTEADMLIRSGIWRVV